MDIRTLGYLSQLSKEWNKKVSLTDEYIISKKTNIKIKERCDIYALNPRIFGVSPTEIHDRSFNWGHVSCFFDPNDGNSENLDTHLWYRETPFSFNQITEVDGYWDFEEGKVEYSNAKTVGKRPKRGDILYILGITGTIFYFLSETIICQSLDMSTPFSPFEFYPGYFPFFTRDGTYLDLNDKIVSAIRSGITVKYGNLIFLYSGVRYCIHEDGERNVSLKEWITITSEIYLRLDRSIPQDPFCIHLQLESS